MAAWPATRGMAGARVGVHFHNDSACAVANSLVAVAAGGLHVQGAANGYGERCGNADLFSVIAGLELKRGHELLPPGRLSALASTARTIADVANLPFDARQPYVGRSRSRPRPGCTPRPSRGGRTPTPTSSPPPWATRPQVLVCELAGRSNVLAKAAELGLDLAPRAGRPGAGPGQGGRAPRLRVRGGRRLVRAAGPAQRRGAADLVRAGGLPGRHRARRRAGPQRGHRPAAARRATGWWPSARASARCTRWTRRCAAALAGLYPALADIRLVDYKVRILDGRDATRAVTRVMLDLGRPRRGVDDGRGVGRHRTASWEALADGVAYGLLRAGAAAPGYQPASPEMRAGG